MISAENVTLPMPPPESTHRLAIEDGTLTVSAQGNDDGPMVSTPHDQLGPLTTWAAKAGPQTSVEIDPAGLDVQGLVDIIVALRGPECRLLGFMHGEEAPEECHVLHYRFPAGGAN
jgi:hypothetical protein